MTKNNNYINTFDIIDNDNSNIHKINRLARERIVILTACVYRICLALHTVQLLQNNNCFNTNISQTLVLFHIPQLCSRVCSVERAVSVVRGRWCLLPTQYFHDQTHDRQLVWLICNLGFDLLSIKCNWNLGALGHKKKYIPANNAADVPTVS